MLRREGSSSSGDRVYLCRCRICGKEKLFPACTIRGLVKSCGCKAHDPEKLKKASKQGVLASCIDGCNVYTATRTAPDSDNTTGYRWVRVQRWKGKGYISAVFYIRGQRYYRGGFLSREAAYVWASAAHEEALQREGITDPRKSKEEELTHD